VDPGRITPEAFRQALKTMGVKAVSPVYGDARLWDLSIPPASLKSVEAYLKTLGKLQVLGKTAPAPPSGAPHRRLARVLFPN
jgi:hypothetical protein